MKEPKIRFKEFKGEWEEITLGEIAPLVGGYAFKSANFEKIGIPIVRISNILDSGVVGGDFAKYKCFEGDTSFRLYDGDTVIAMSGATTGKVAVVKTQTFLYQNQRVGKFSRTDKIFYTFVSIFVGSKKFANALDRKLTASAQPNASSKDIDSIKLSFPSSKDEQQRIASFFTKIDAQISASTSRLASLKQIKAASLQAMFPQEGETTPRVRFKGFEGEWETAPLGSLVNIYDGVHQTPNYKDRGIMFLSVEDISSLKSNKYISEEDFNQFYKVFPEKGDILMTRIGDVGTPNVVETNEKIAYYVSLALLKPKGVNSRFLSYCIQSHQFQKNLKLRTLTVAIPQKINKVEIGKVECTYSSNIKEQESIASYFTNLDRQITLQTQRLEKLKQIKAACLDNMFV